ncbi:MAG: DNA cytosine methyltransferase [Bacteroidales bacterium]|nr:DNA cytosine methyltransferase [Bacteroidales bacterium]
MQYTEVKMGIDLCSQHAEVVDVANSIIARYDAGLINHKYEHTGVLEVNKLGNVGDADSQGRSVYDKEGYCPTLCAGMDHGNTMPFITEERRLMVSMRGRNPENPSDRSKGADLEQRLEVNDTDVANTLTTVQKDNLVLEEKGIKIRQADKQGYALCEIGGAADLNYTGSQTRRGRVIENGRICPTLTTENIPNVIELGNEKFYNFIYKIGEEWWLIRIRKLTPRECWRLMGFYDEDFDKAEKVNSNTQLYKQAGNSIVVNVLEEIFKQMIGE